MKLSVRAHLCTDERRTSAVRAAFDCFAVPACGLDYVGPSCAGASARLAVRFTRLPLRHC